MSLLKFGNKLIGIAPRYDVEALLYETGAVSAPASDPFVQGGTLTIDGYKLRRNGTQLQIKVATAADTTYTNVISTTNFIFILYKNAAKIVTIPLAETGYSTDSISDAKIKIINGLTYGNYLVDIGTTWTATPFTMTLLKK